MGQTAPVKPARATGFDLELTKYMLEHGERFKGIVERAVDSTMTGVLNSYTDQRLGELTRTIELQVSSRFELIALMEEIKLQSPENRALTQAELTRATEELAITQRELKDARRVIRELVKDGNLGKYFSRLGSRLKGLCGPLAPLLETVESETGNSDSVRAMCKLTFELVETLDAFADNARAIGEEYGG